MTDPHLASDDTAIHAARDPDTVMAKAKAAAREAFALWLDTPHPHRWEAVEGAARGVTVEYWRQLHREAGREP